MLGFLLKECYTSEILNWENILFFSLVSWCLKKKAQMLCFNMKSKEKSCRKSTIGTVQRFEDLLDSVIFDMLQINSSSFSQFVGFGLVPMRDYTRIAKLHQPD